MYVCHCLRAWSMQHMPLWCGPDAARLHLRRHGTAATAVPWQRRRIYIGRSYWVPSGFLIPSGLLLGSIHGSMRAARHHLDVGFCPVCLLHFSSPERVVANLHEKAQRCLRFVLEHFPRLHPDDVRVLDTAERDRLRLHRRPGRRRGWTVSRLHGPLPDTGLVEFGRRHHAP